MLTHLSLFTGIGGIDLAAEWAGFETVGQVEWADYPTKVLEKHWPDVPRWRDIRDLTMEDFYGRTGLETVELISGGFPCQPFSVAGKQRGHDDDRYLWPEMLRIIRSLRPRWVLGENVPGILRIAGHDVCQSLVDIGYSVAIFSYEAAAVGARHRRGRIFFVGYAEHDGSSIATLSRIVDCNEKQAQEWGKATVEFERASRSCDFQIVGDANIGRLQAPRSSQQTARIAGTSEYVADTDSERRQRSENTGEIERSGQVCEQFASGCDPGEAGRSTKPRLGRGLDGLSERLDGIRRSWLDGTWELGIPRVATGVKNRADRIKALGNAVVPQQIYPILKAIADFERQKG